MFLDKNRILICEVFVSLNGNLRINFEEYLWNTMFFMYLKNQFKPNVKTYISFKNLQVKKVLSEVLSFLLN